MKNRGRLTEGARRRLRTMTLLLMLTCSAVVTGCVTKAVPVASDRWVTSLRSGQVFTAPCDGKFVPMATYLELQEAFDRAGYR